MDAYLLACLVEQVRTMQKAYFKRRDPAVLGPCRDLEKKLDVAVQQILDKARPHLPGLYPPGDTPGAG